MIDAVDGCRQIAAFAFALVAGCDVVLGIDPPRDASPIQPLVHGRVRERYATNTATFEPEVRERLYGAGAVAIAVTLDDGTQAKVDYDPVDGTFSFPVAHEGQRYRMLVNADGSDSVFEHTSADFRLAFLYAGRPDRPARQQTFLRFDYPPIGVATSVPYIATTGIWSYSTATTVGPSVVFDWLDATEVEGSRRGLGMLDASRYDEVHVFELAEYPPLPGPAEYTRIEAAVKASVTQAALQTADLPPPTDVPPNACARFATRNATERARIAQATQRTYDPTASGADWLLFMAPEPRQLGLSGMIWVALGTTPNPTDLEVSPSFYQPFAGAEALVQAGAFGTFGVLLPGTTTPMVLSDTSRRFHPIELGVPASCTSPRVALDGMAAIAGMPSIDGVVLDSDGAVVTLDLSRDPVVTWPVAVPGAVHWTRVNLQELRAVSGATTLHHVAAVNAVGGSATLDRALFVPGRFYNIAITINLMFPDAASGDYDTVALPIESVTTWSRWFELRGT